MTDSLHSFRRPPEQSVRERIRLRLPGTMRDEFDRVMAWEDEMLDEANHVAQRADLYYDALMALYKVALNGAVCTPPDTWQDPLYGGDGSGRMFDVEALKCDECRNAWRRVVSLMKDEDDA